MTEITDHQSSVKVAKLQLEIARLNKIIQALIDRAERNASQEGSGFDLFHKTVMLEDQVNQRTLELKAALSENEKITRDLRESEIHNRLLVENSPMCIHEIDMHGRICSMNRSGLDMMELTAEADILGYAYLDTVATIDRERIADLLAKAYAGETSYFEFHASTKQNRIYKSCFVPIKNKAGAVEKLMGITEDISERKRIENALKELNRDFVAFLENTTDYIYFLDDECRFRFCSQTLADMSGFTSWRDLTGKRVHEVFPEDMANSFYKDELSVLDNKVPQLNKTVQFFDKQGTQGWINTNKWPVLDRESCEPIGLFGISRDVTEQKQLEQKLEKSEALFHAIFDQAPFGIQLIEPDTLCLIEANPAACEMLGYSHDEFVHLRLDNNPVGIDSKSIKQALAQIMTTGNSISQASYHSKMGKTLEVEVHAHILNLPGKRLLVEIWRDITEYKKAEERIRSLAFYDPLTQLANRRLLNEHLQQALAAGKRSGSYGAVLYLDLDNFKPINDQHGHDVGDLLLIEVSRRLKDCVRETDTVARIGGDEFVVMLGKLASKHDESVQKASVVAEKIRLTLAEPYQLTHKLADNSDFTIQHACFSSIGVIIFSRDDISPEELIKLADREMYRAKQNGRNRVCMSNR